MIADIRTGTMGWSYEDWRGPFYERDTPANRLLEKYARIPGFATVELDTTFYGIPRPSTLKSWHDQTPSDFIFSAKVPRAITHERRLVNASEAALDFSRILRENLTDKLGALLIQLHPDFSVADRPTLVKFIESITSRRAMSGIPPRWVVELRSASWLGTDIVAEMAEYGVSVASTERLDLGGPLRYVRLLGVEGSFTRFDERQADRSNELSAWASRLDNAHCEPDSASPILVYVRNNFEGHAPATIADLRSRLGLETATPPGKHQMSLF